MLIRVKAAGVCGTDLHIYHDKFRYWPPVVLGHEFSGEIVNVEKENALDRVMELTEGKGADIVAHKAKII